jgi:intracellular sulfur oxidation DsrE/DsrF family protein
LHLRRLSHNRADPEAFMRLLRLLPLFVLLFTAPALAEGPHRLALQISDNDPDKMNAVLNVAANVSKYYSDKGEEVEIQIVAFNAGLHMLREDTSPVKPRLAGFGKSMPNVSFKACQNTIDAMGRREKKEIPIMAGAEHVPAGVVTLIELGEKGWTIVRP